MAHETIHVSRAEFAAELSELLDRVARNQETVLVENGTDPAIEVRPARRKRRRELRLRPVTPEDYAIFLSSFGGWSDVDDEALLRDIYESRSAPPKPPVEL